MTPLIELTDDQRRQYIDAEATFDALEHAEKEAWRHRGYMWWREQNGRTYLIRTWPNTKQNSLGVESEATRTTYETFTTRKEQVEQRVKDLRAAAEQMRRLNRALRVGRTPDIVVQLLATLAKAKVADYFLLVGTHALYAYEAAAGVRLPNDVLATRDADFLYDTRARVEFVQTMQERGLSFLDLLRKADKTFERHPTDSHTAVNSKGFEVDLLRRFPPPELEAEEHPVQMTPNEDDLWAVRASTGQELLSAPTFSQVVVSATGHMARARTVHPLDFARTKRQLAADPNRDPNKAPKDAAQAALVETLVQEYLPNLLQGHEAQEPAEQDQPQERERERERGSSN